MADFIEVYQDRHLLLRRWRWRRVAGNGKIVADSGQGYTRKASAIRAAEKVAPGLEIRTMAEVPHA